MNVDGLFRQLAREPIQDNIYSIRVHLRLSAANQNYQLAADKRRWTQIDFSAGNQRTAY